MGFFKTNGEIMTSIKDMKILKILGVCIALLLLMAVLIPACSAEGESESGDEESGDGDSGDEGSSDDSSSEEGEDGDESGDDGNSTSTHKKKVVVDTKIIEIEVSVEVEVEDPDDGGDAGNITDDVEDGLGDIIEGIAEEVLPEESISDWWKIFTSDVLGVCT